MYFKVLQSTVPTSRHTDLLLHAKMDTESTHTRFRTELRRRLGVEAIGGGGGGGDEKRQTEVALTCKKKGRCRPVHPMKRLSVF